MILPALLGVGLFFAAPRITDAVKDNLRTEAKKDVAEVFQRETPSKITAGQIVITESQLSAIINDADNRDSSWHMSGMTVIIEDGTVRLVGRGTDDGVQKEITIYGVTPAIVDGQFVLTDRSGALRIFKTAQDAISDELENQTNGLFADSGVKPVSVTAENGRLVIVTK